MIGNTIFQSNCVSWKRGVRGKDSFFGREDMQGEVVDDNLDMLGLAKDFCLLDMFNWLRNVITHKLSLLTFRFRRKVHLAMWWNSEIQNLCVCVCVFVAIYCLIINPHSLTQESVTHSRPFLGIDILNFFNVLCTLLQKNVIGEFFWLFDGGGAFISCFYLLIDQ